MFTSSSSSTSTTYSGNWASDLATPSGVFSDFFQPRDANPGILEDSAAKFIERAFFHVMNSALSSTPALRRGIPLARKGADFYTRLEAWREILRESLNARRTRLTLIRTRPTRARRAKKTIAHKLKNSSSSSSSSNHDTMTSKVAIPCQNAFVARASLSAANHARRLDAHHRHPSRCF